MDALSFYRSKTDLGTTITRNNQFFETVTMATPTKLQNPTILDQRGPTKGQLISKANSKLFT